jgi:hypothetical protein
MKSGDLGGQFCGPIRLIIPLRIYDRISFTDVLVYVLIGVIWKMYCKLSNVTLS